MTQRTVLVVLLHGIGDCLMALPAIEALKKQSPNTKIAVMTIRNPVYHDLFRKNKAIDVLLFSRLTHNPHYGNPFRFFRERQIIQRDIEKAVADYRCSKVYFIKMFLMPSKIYKYLPFRTYKEHKAYRTARELGVTIKNPRYILKPHSHDLLWAASYLRNHHLSQKKLAGVHFTGSSPAKSLSFEQGKKIIQQLKQKGYQPLLFHNRASYEREKNHYSAEDVTTYISDSILHTLALLHYCQFFIGIDSGVAHLAAALNKKIFVIYFLKIWRYNSLPLGGKVYPYIHHRHGKDLPSKLHMFLEQ